MRFPTTAAPLYFLLDPSRKFVAFNQFAYPTLQVQSVINRATETAVIQSASDHQPQWANNAVGGAYIARNEPGYPGTSGSSPGVDGLLFNGAAGASRPYKHAFSFDSIASKFADTDNMTVVAVVSCAASSFRSSIFSLASSSSATPSLSMYYLNGSIYFREVNSHNSYVVSATLNNNCHLLTASKINNVLTLKVNGFVVGTPTTITPGTDAFNTFTVGASSENGSVTAHFSGAMGKLAVYGGAADVADVEKELMLEYGIIRG